MDIQYHIYVVRGSYDLKQGWGLEDGYSVKAH